MKTVLLGLAVAGFAVGSASAECSFGMASHGKPAKVIAQSQPVKMPEVSNEKVEVVMLKDAWLVNYLNNS